jgi:hypothetical protein
MYVLYSFPDLVVLPPVTPDSCYVTLCPIVRLPLDCIHSEATYIARLLYDTISSNID